MHETPPTAPDTLPALVRHMRTVAGLSREALAEMTGVNARTVATWETEEAYGRTIPTRALVSLLHAAGYGQDDAVIAHAMRTHAAALRVETAAL